MAFGEKGQVQERTHEEILVLYGSQTSNSEGAAKEIASSIAHNLPPSKICEFDGPANLRVTGRVMTLDDFLEIEKAKWPRLVVIVTSSYGVGQAPLGARRFRELCDELLERYGYFASDAKKIGKEDDSMQGKILDGVTFAMLGLGDSHYSTFFRNPTVIEDALTTVGAKRVGPLGKADASGVGDLEQSKVINRWIEEIWRDLAMVVAKDPPNPNLLLKAQEETWKICLELFKDWRPTNYFVIAALFLPLSGVLLGVIVYFVLHVVLA